MNKGGPETKGGLRQGVVSLLTATHTLIDTFLVIVMTLTRVEIVQDALTGCLEGLMRPELDNITTSKQGLPKTEHVVRQRDLSMAER